MNVVMPRLALAVVLFGLYGCATPKPPPPPPPGASFEEFDRRARGAGPVSVVFYGGALTWGSNASDPLRTSYRALMEEYLRERYPQTVFDFHNAAIGGGSKLGMFRLRHDVLRHRPDLVILDFTVEDNPDGTDRETLTSYERILNDLIHADIPVLQVFFAHRRDFGANWKPVLPVRMRDHIELARLYRTGVANAATPMQTFITEGRHPLEEIWPSDHVYPNDLGHRVIFESVRDGFDEAVRQKRVCSAPLFPVFADHYSTMTQIFFTELPLPAGWDRGASFSHPPVGVANPWLRPLVICGNEESEAVQPLQVAFTGTTVGLVGEADESSMGFRVVLDGKPLPYREKKDSRPQGIWPTSTEDYGGGKLFFWRELADHLASGPHTLEIHPVFSEESGSGQLRLESVCVAGEPPGGIKVR